MLRRIAAGTSAAFVAAGLAAAPAVASGLPASGGDSCGDVAQTEQNGLDPHTTQGFVFGPLADVLHFHSGERACFTVAATAAEASPARRKSSAPPPVGTPVPEVPSTSPPDDSGPGVPGPSDFGPPPSAETAGPPAPDFTPVTVPPPDSPGTTPTSSPAAFRGPDEIVRPAAQPPAAPRLPQTASDTRPITVAGGASLVAAGLAWIGGARRRMKRPAGRS